MGDDSVSLPVELFALNIEDLKSTIFTAEVWNSLDDASKEQLKVRHMLLGLHRGHFLSSHIFLDPLLP